MEQSPFLVEAADRLAIAVLEAVDRGDIADRTKISDTLEGYADIRFDNHRGDGISLMRGLPGYMPQEPSLVSTNEAQLRSLDNDISEALLRGALENGNTPLDDYGKRAVRAVQEMLREKFPWLRKG